MIEEKAHARLSASGSSKWIGCSGSIQAEEHSGTSFVSDATNEGSCAHHVAELCLENGTTPKSHIGETYYNTVVSLEMADYVQMYIDYVHRIGGMQFYENRVDFSHIVPDGFGTADCLAVNGSHLDVIDLKYGIGVEVSAKENSQGMLYALGALHELEDSFNIETVTIHIFQPRKGNISSWDISVNELIDWGIYAEERALLALEERAKRTPGEKQCHFCTAKTNCGVLAQYVEDLINGDLEDMLRLRDPSELTDEDVKIILDNKKLIVKFLDDIEKEAKRKLEKGDFVFGYKLVEGRPTRKWTSEEKAVEFLKNHLPEEELYTKKIISITAAEKKLGKSVFKDIPVDVIHKVNSKPAMAVEEDARKEVSFSGVSEDIDAIFDFDNVI